MARIYQIYFFILLMTGLSACRGTRQTPRVDISPAASVSRTEVLAIAEAYRVHQWRPQAHNVRHGNDSRGIRIDTPDSQFKPKNGIRPGWWIVGEWNQGVPYQWGGFDSLEQFDAKVSAGLAAGDVYTLAKRAALNDAVSPEACGIDCSGFISRCWRLPRAYSTRELPTLCQPLQDISFLQPGDILNKTNEHVLLFAGWADAAKSRYFAYETGSPPTWKVVCNTIPVAYTSGLGYQPFRYLGIREDDTPDSKFD